MLSFWPQVEFLLSCFSRVWLFAILWTIAHQVPLSMGFSRQEYWSGLPGLSPGDLFHPRIKPKSPVSSVSQVDSLPLSHQESPGWVQVISNSRFSYMAKKFFWVTIIIKWSTHPRDSEVPLWSSCRPIEHMGESHRQVVFSGEKCLPGVHVLTQWFPKWGA